MRSALRRSEHARFEVIDTQDLEEALAEARSGTCDVVLVDGALPGRSGEDLLETLLPVCGAAVVVYQAGGTTDPGLLDRGAEDVLLHRDLASAWLGRLLRHAVARHGVHTELEASEQRLRKVLEVRRRTLELEQRLVLADRLASVNLLVNAAHAVDEGHIGENRVTVRIGETDDGVGLFVEGTGCGIPSENLEKIFEPFFTTRGAGARARPGAEPVCRDGPAPRGQPAGQRPNGPRHALLAHASPRDRAVGVHPERSPAAQGA